MQPTNDPYDRRSNRGFHAQNGDDLDLDQRGDSRRRSHRLSLRLWTEGRSDGRLDYHNCSNLSEEGMFIENASPYALGEAVQIEFNLPGVHRVLSVVGRVVSSLDEDNAGANIMGNGFTFEHISPADRDLVNTYLATMRVAD